ncbi:hypothetical protein [Rhodoferax sp.]|uniref:hypothetical protein n=1 Tax=Rhodoferax sp. TaxID=50421 RepID=UPI0026254346|nr:hypothetical protein [Rhodoferax sp.]MDD2810632.1 hypothetical protein [Rhodoferax sp.]
MTALILLGAGASFGSGDVQPCCPPLGNGPDGLFARLDAAGGQAASLPADLKTLFRTDFERGMTQFYEFADGDIMRFQREMAAYLAAFKPGGANAYVRLIRTIGPRRAIYASLNYDLLFELAAGYLGLNTFYSADPPMRGVRLLKLHGSSNFWPDIPVGMIRGSTFKRSGRADIQAHIKPLNQEETLYRCSVEDSVAPAIAMYAEGKAVKISPDYVERQQEFWTAAVRSASRIFVVGVRVHNADVHVWGELGKAGAPLTYFGREWDKQPYEQWTADNRKRNSYFIEANFDECIAFIGRQLGRI